MNIDFSLIKMQNNVDITQIVYMIVFKACFLNMRQWNKNVCDIQFSQVGLMWILQSIREGYTFYKKRDCDNYRRPRNKIALVW